MATPRAVTLMPYRCTTCGEYIQWPPQICTLQTQSLKECRNPEPKCLTFVNKLDAHFASLVSKFTKYAQETWDAQYPAATDDLPVAEYSLPHYYMQTSSINGPERVQDTVLPANEFVQGSSTNRFGPSNAAYDGDRQTLSIPTISAPNNIHRPVSNVNDYFPVTAYTQPYHTIPAQNSSSFALPALVQDTQSAPDDFVQGSSSNPYGPSTTYHYSDTQNIWSTAPVLPDTPSSQYPINPSFTQTITGRDPDAVAFERLDHKAAPENSHWMPGQPTDACNSAFASSPLPQNTDDTIYRDDRNENLESDLVYNDEKTKNTYTSALTSSYYHYKGRSSDGTEIPQTSMAERDKPLASLDQPRVSCAPGKRKRCEDTPNGTLPETKENGPRVKEKRARVVQPTYHDANKNAVTVLESAATPLIVTSRPRQRAPGRKRKVMFPGEAVMNLGDAAYMPGTGSFAAEILQVQPALDPALSSSARLRFPSRGQLTTSLEPF